MPAVPGQRVDVIGRIRATVLVADGMLSAFENVGRPDPAVAMAVTDNDLVQMTRAGISEDVIISTMRSRNGSMISPDSMIGST